MNDEQKRNTEEIINLVVVVAKEILQRAPGGINKTELISLLLDKDIWEAAIPAGKDSKHAIIGLKNMSGAELLDFIAFGISKFR